MTSGLLRSLPASLAIAVSFTLSSRLSAAPPVNLKLRKKTPLTRVRRLRPAIQGVFFISAPEANATLWGSTRHKITWRASGVDEVDLDLIVKKHLVGETSPVATERTISLMQGAKAPGAYVWTVRPEHFWGYTSTTSLGARNTTLYDSKVVLRLSGRSAAGKGYLQLRPLVLRVPTVDITAPHWDANIQQGMIDYVTWRCRGPRSDRVRIQIRTGGQAGFVVYRKDVSNDGKAAFRPPATCRGNFSPPFFLQVRELIPDARWPRVVPIRDGRRIQLN